MLSKPTNEVCRFCGKPLERLELPVQGKKFFVGYKECDCDEARKERAEKELEERVKADLKAKEKHERAYKRAGIQKKFMSAEHPNAQTVLEGIKAGRGAYVFGSVGTGKTYLASAVAKLAVDEKMSVMMTDMQAIAADLKACFGGEVDEEKVLQRYADYDLLVLDDLGKEAPTEWMLAQVYRVINARYASESPVIVTTQYKPKALGERLARKGDVDTALAIVSRLSEMCSRIEFKGADRRLL